MLGQLPYRHRTGRRRKTFAGFGFKSRLELVPFHAVGLELYQHAEVLGLGLLRASTMF